MRKAQCLVALWAVLGAAAPAVLAQPDRITARIDNSRSVVFSGRVHRLATAQYDAGPVEPGFVLPGITLTLKPSAAQQADLNQLLMAQQDPASANFRQWLTPEQYADRFGASAGDLAKITAWAESQGFTVTYTARGRNYVTFSGTAQQVGSAFHTQIHRYNVNGESHFANATDPSIPAALAGLVSGIRGLNDFKLKPRLRKVQPQALLGRETVVAPADFANIYDVARLYSNGINGTGQKIVVVGQSQVLASDISNFRTIANLGTANLQTVRVPNSPNPGVVPGDETESDLDIEWAGAVAPKATIVFVFADPSDGGVWGAAQYAIDHDLAPVLSMSYGSCEEFDLVDLDNERAEVQKGALEGITFLAAAGDSGSADCDDGNPVNEPAPAMASGGLAVDAPGSIPEVTSMGGTQFNEGSVNYWSTGTASGYIPEIVWNDIPFDVIGGGGGGASVYFAQPPWQNGIAPFDGWRHVPDISSASSDSHDPLFIYTSDTTFSSSAKTAVGGTSCAAPSMAGIVALLNQYLVSSGAIKQPGLGNINPTLYQLSQTSQYGNAFHDITQGDNIQACAPNSPNCADGLLTGWSTATGYDSASGLGSVDAYNLAQAWSTALATQAVVVATIDQNPVYETSASSNTWTFMLTLTEEAGFPATVTGLTINGITFTSQQIQSLLGSTTIPAHGTLSGSYSLANLNLFGGLANVVFNFSFAEGSATWNTSMTVPFTGPQPQLSINQTSNNGSGACHGVGNAASGQVAFAPGGIISVYGTGLGNFAQAASITPLPEYMAGFEASVDFVPAPLYYVSPTQVNLQVPYETVVGMPGGSVLEVGNPYTYLNCYITIASAAPGIFSYADTSTNSSPIGSGSAKVGQEVAIYVTGVGHLTIDPDDGSTPLNNSNPPPTLPVSVTVGGVTVAKPFAYIGTPNWSVGVLQINFTIPSGVGTGQQPVVVTVGTAASSPANITISQ